MVLEVPPGLQGILDDFFQRPICNPEPSDEKTSVPGTLLQRHLVRRRQDCPGPDKGKGANYLVIPPDYKGDIPKDYIVYKSRTYNVFVFWRAFFKSRTTCRSPSISSPRRRSTRSVRRTTPSRWSFPDGSKVSPNMLYPTDGSAFDMLSPLHRQRNMSIRWRCRHARHAGSASASSKGNAFSPDAHAREILDKAGKTAFRIGRAIAYDPPPIVPNTRWYKDRQWVDPLPGQSPSSPARHSNISIFAPASSRSPTRPARRWPSTWRAWARNIRWAFTDANGDPLSGGKSYRLNLPKDIPAGIFWSVTVYRPEQHRA